MSGEEIAVMVAEAESQHQAEKECIDKKIAVNSLISDNNSLCHLSCEDITKEAEESQCSIKINSAKEKCQRMEQICHISDEDINNLKSHLSEKTCTEEFLSKCENFRRSIATW